MAEEKPILAITMGDPAGVGPEIIAKALSRRESRGDARLLVVGDGGVMERAIEVTGVNLRIERVADPGRTGDRADTLYLLDLRNVERGGFEYGKLSPACARAAYEAIERAIELSLAGEVAGNVTAPINKEALQLAGINYAGHTEIYADKTGTTDYAMMLVHQGLHVVHVSTHVSLREACDLVTRERVEKVVLLARDALRRLGAARPKLAVAGLNPHAGENGMFGREELEEIVPALEAMRERGIDVLGPISPDTLFPRAAAGEYDCVIAMYHDQGHVPLKLLGFRYDAESGGFADVKGVNVTLGLPIVRTSVDHGTAFDRAGTGTANEASQVEAIRYAARLCKR
jgi:4-hydroxythreonine-4-phosphate dehydrogenase